MTTIQTANNSERYSIPASNEQYEDEFQVTVRLSDRTTKNYACKNTDDWKKRVRGFVQRVKDNGDCHIDTVTISHVVNGERVERKQWIGYELTTIN